MKISIEKIELTGITFDDEEALEATVNGDELLVANLKPTAASEGETLKTELTLEERIARLEALLPQLARGIGHPLFKDMGLPKAVRVALAELFRQGRADESTVKNMMAP